MVTGTQNPRYDTLTTMVRAWDRRLRQRQTLAWSARSLMPGLLLGVVTGVIAHLRPTFTAQQVSLIALGGALLGFVAMLAYVWLRERAVINAARRFDVRFNLQERVSTALELMEGRIEADPSLSNRQLDDAYERASAVNARDQLPYQPHWREWAIVALLAAGVVLLVMLPNAQATAVTTDTEREAIIERGVEDVQDAIEEVATDPNLDEATREDLLQELETSLNTLQDEAVSADEALATLEDVEELLEREAGSLNEDVDVGTSDMEAANETLNDEPSQAQPHEPAGQEGGANPMEAAGSLSNSLGEMAEQSGEMSQSQANESAERLEQAAEQLSQSQPETAQSMREAAESLRQGDNQSASESLEQAAQQAQQAGQQSQSQQQSAQNLQQSADQMNQTQQQFSQQNQQANQQAGQQSGQNQQGDQQQQGQQGPQGQGQQQGQQGQQQGQQQQGQQGQQSGQQQGQQGQQGNQGQQSQEGSQGQQSQQGQGGQQGQSGQEGQRGQTEGSQSSSTGDSARAGDQPGTLREDTSGIEADPSQGESQSDEGGERDYEAIFDPRQLPDSAQSEDDITLDPDVGNAPLQEGDFSDNPEGDATVPYNQVYRDYADAANEALEQGYVPLALRDVVRDYFTSLAPQSADGENSTGRE